MQSHISFPGVLWLWHFLYSFGTHPVSSLHIYTSVVSLAFMAGADSQAGDADSSRAPGLTSGLQGSMNIHRGALLLVPQWRRISSFVFCIDSPCLSYFDDHGLYHGHRFLHSVTSTIGKFALYIFAKTGWFASLTLSYFSHLSDHDHGQEEIASLHYNASSDTFSPFQSLPCNSTSWYDLWTLHSPWGPRGFKIRICPLYLHVSSKATKWAGFSE